MQFRRVVFSIPLLGLASLPMAAQETGGAAPTIRSERRVVLVDTIVTDKKGAYVTDLTTKDFHVFEDNKEQTISSFSFEAGEAGPNKSQKRYLVLFFDDSNMDLATQSQARQAAAKFLEANAGPNRPIAIVDFTGSLKIAQNFTEDADRLKKVVAGLKIPSVSANGSGVEVASLGSAGLSSAAADFAARDVILAVRTLARNLSGVPGRKSLVFLSGGFPLTPEYLSELTALTDTCNKSNVAIYPIDVRGLMTGGPSAGPRGALLPLIQPSVFTFTGNSPFSVLPAFFQKGGPGGGATPGGGGRGGSTPGAGGSTPGGGAPRGGSTPGSGNTGNPGSGSVGRGNTGGNTGGRVGTPVSTAPTRPGNIIQQNPFGTNPMNQPRSILPSFPESATTNQQVLEVMAHGTGGFMIANTNDLLGGLEKISKDQDNYYLLGYTPTEAADGTCHVLKVKVERSGTIVRARSGYCNVKPRDLLAGNSTEKELEAKGAAAAPGTVKASMQAPFFYTSPNTARVNVAMEMAPDALNFEKEKGRFRGSINILGVAYLPDGGVAAKFSDTVKLEFDKKELKAFQEQPFLHYEKQFDIASGTYNLKVVFSTGGQDFGKLELPLVIDKYDSKQFTMSGLALSKELHKAADMSIGRDAELLEDRAPLVVPSSGVEVTPSGSSKFKRSDPVALYAEIYDPLMLSSPLPDKFAAGVQIRVLDRKSGEAKQDSGLFRVPIPAQVGNPVIPIGLKVPIEGLTAGNYRVEVKAVDTSGNKFLRTADFDLE